MWIDGESKRKLLILIISRPMSLKLDLDHYVMDKAVQKFIMIYRNADWERMPWLCGITGMKTYCGDPMPMD